MALQRSAQSQVVYVQSYRFIAHVKAFSVSNKEKSIQGVNRYYRRGKDEVALILFAKALRRCARPRRFRLRMHTDRNRYLMLSVSIGVYLWFQLVFCAFAPLREIATLEHSLKFKCRYPSARQMLRAACRSRRGRFLRAGPLKIFRSCSSRRPCRRPWPA